MPDAPAAAKRLLLVHAHPDDETIGQGATMAKYVAEGVQVTLVTCTLGEMGEVLVPDLEHLAFAREGGLGGHRIGELDAAMKVLGVTDHRFLGGPGRFHDSGMAWDENHQATVAPDVPPGAFWHADLTEAADLLVETLREVRPQVLVTYDDRGGYGHPDHVQAHRVATYAVALAGVPSYKPHLGAAWDVAKVYWSSTPAGQLREWLRALRASGDTTAFNGIDPEGPLPPFAVDDELITACVDARDQAELKMQALREHATQVDPDGAFFALRDGENGRDWGREYYRLAKGVPGPRDPATGLEPDLFAGLDVGP